MVSPITPAEAKAQKLESIPDYVIDIVNQAIVENLVACRQSSVHKDTLVREIFNHTISNNLRDETEDKIRAEIYDKHWLDFEDMYRANGWSVSYDRGHFRFEAE